MFRNNHLIMSVSSNNKYLFCGFPILVVKKFFDFFFQGLFIYVFVMPVQKKNPQLLFWPCARFCCGFVRQLVSWPVSLLVVCWSYSWWVFWFLGLLYIFYMDIINYHTYEDHNIIYLIICKKLLSMHHLYLVWCKPGWPQNS